VDDDARGLHQHAPGLGRVHEAPALLAEPVRGKALLHADLGQERLERRVVCWLEDRGVDRGDGRTAGEFGQHERASEEEQLDGGSGLLGEFAEPLQDGGQFRASKDHSGCLRGLH
jgi:hypothetical protein